MNRFFLSNAMRFICFLLCSFSSTLALGEPTYVRLVFQDPPQCLPTALNKITVPKKAFAQPFNPLAPTRTVEEAQAQYQAIRAELGKLTELQQRLETALAKAYADGAASNPTALVHVPPLQLKLSEVNFKISRLKRGYRPERVVHTPYDFDQSLIREERRRAMQLSEAEDDMKFALAMVAEKENTKVKALEKAKAEIAKIQKAVKEARKSPDPRELAVLKELEEEKQFAAGKLQRDLQREIEAAKNKVADAQVVLIEERRAATKARARLQAEVERERLHNREALLVDAEYWLNRYIPRDSKLADAIEKAHHVGGPKHGGIGKYSRDEWRQKLTILMKQGDLSTKDADLLLRKGVCGEWDYMHALLQMDGVVVNDLKVFSAGSYNPYRRELIIDALTRNFGPPPLADLRRLEQLSDAELASHYVKKRFDSNIPKKALPHPRPVTEQPSKTMASVGGFNTHVVEWDFYLREEPLSLADKGKIGSIELVPGEVTVVEIQDVLSDGRAVVRYFHPETKQFLEMTIPENLFAQGPPWLDGKKWKTLPAKAPSSHLVTKESAGNKVVGRIDSTENAATPDQNAGLLMQLTQDTREAQRLLEETVMSKYLSKIFPFLGRGKFIASLQKDGTLIFDDGASALAYGNWLESLPESQRAIEDIGRVYAIEIKRGDRVRVNLLDSVKGRRRPTFEQRFVEDKLQKELEH